MRVSVTAVARSMGLQGSRRKLRYSVASVASVIVGQVVLAMVFGGLRWSARSANLIAFCAAALASYHLNRIWVWSRLGRSSLLREVVPFGVIAAIGLAASTWAVQLAENRTADVIESHALRTTAVMLASVVSVMVVWVAKFVVLDRFLFLDSVPLAESSGGQRSDGSEEQTGSDGDLRRRGRYGP